MALGAKAFEACYAMLPDARCTVRIRGKAEIARALCTGVLEGSEPTDQGIALFYDGNIRFLEADDPGGIKVGDKIEVKRSHDTDWLTVRVAARMQVAGAVRLSLEGPNQT
jgi:hypothetical protein